jgi:transcriptional regulator with XRE-family HTH domain
MTAGEERHRDERALWFGDNVRQNRERKGMSQGDLARKMTERGWPWHQSTVYKTEHGSRRTEAFELHDLAEILGVPMGHLFWPPAEVGEAAMVERSIVMLRRAREETAAATRTLLAARAWAERTLEQHGDSKYERVRRTCAELEIELAEHTLDAAIDEGEYRYEHRGDED